MQIVCPQCTTAYHIDPSILGMGGRSVRCVRCRNLWFAVPPGALLAAHAVASTMAEEEAAFSSNDAPPHDEAALADPAADEVELAEEHSEPMAGSEPEPAPSLDESAVSPPAQEPPPQEETLDIVPERVTPEVADAPSIVPPLEDARRPDHGVSEPSEDIESFAARRARLYRERHRARWSRSGLPAMILVLFAVTAALIGWRINIVRFAPQTASFYAAVGLPVNLRGLVFDKVQVTHETQDGIPVLVVEGQIVSVANRPVEVPRLRLAMRNSAGVEIYSWTSLPARPVVAPGEAFAFRSRLASPPADGRDVSLRFFSRRDAMTGMK